MATSHPLGEAATATWATSAELEKGRRGYDMEFLDRISWSFAVIAALTLGLAPFIPEPHIVEKLRMLVKGTLVRPIDIFDMLMHAAPWLLLIAKGVRWALTRSA